MALRTVVQRVCRSPRAPDAASIRSWASAAFEAGGPPGADMALTVRIVSEKEARALNRSYRGSDYAPNVLSFPMNTGDPVKPGLLGDIVICAAVAAREARDRNKPLAAHWSHLVVHGVLHCCGFEHDTDAGAGRMESLETRILAEFGFPDPYTVDDER